MDFSLTENARGAARPRGAHPRGPHRSPAPEGTRPLRRLVRPAPRGRSSRRRTCSASRCPSRPAVSASGSSTSAWCCARSARNVAPLPAIPTLVAGALPIARFGSDAQQAILAKVASGDVLLTAALVEIGAEPLSPTTTATRDGDGWRINGTKSNVAGATAAELVLVPATVDGEVGDVPRADERGRHHDRRASRR